MRDDVDSSTCGATSAFEYRYSDAVNKLGVYMQFDSTTIHPTVSNRAAYRCTFNTIEIACRAALN
jgi:hypothetical protein